MKILNNKGAAFLLAVLLVTVVLILGVSIIGVSTSTYSSAENDAGSQQAFYNAKSAVLTTISYINNNDDSVLSNLFSYTGEGYMGDVSDISNSNYKGYYSVTVTPDSASSPLLLTIKGYGEYNKYSTFEKNDDGTPKVITSTATFTATIKRTMQEASTEFVNDFALAVAHPDSDDGQRTVIRSNVAGAICAISDVYIYGYNNNWYSYPITVTGNVYAGDEVTVNTGATIDGDIFADGFNSTEIAESDYNGSYRKQHYFYLYNDNGHGNGNGGAKKYDICKDATYTNGLISIGSYVTIDGNIYTHGNVEIGNYTTITGSVYTDGYIFLGYGSSIAGNIEASNFVYLEGDNAIGNDAAGGYISTSDAGTGYGDVYIGEYCDIYGDVNAKGNIVQLKEARIHKNMRSYGYMKLWGCIDKNIYSYGAIFFNSTAQCYDIYCHGDFNNNGNSGYYHSTNPLSDKPSIFFTYKYDYNISLINSTTDEGDWTIKDKITGGSATYEEDMLKNKVSIIPQTTTTKEISTSSYITFSKSNSTITNFNITTTSGSPIYIYLDVNHSNSSFLDLTISNLSVTGTGLAYIFLENGSNVEILSETSDTINSSASLFIVGQNEASNLYLGNYAYSYYNWYYNYSSNTTFKAFIYMPSGTVYVYNPIQYYNGKILACYYSNYKNYYNNGNHKNWLYSYTGLSLPASVADAEYYFNFSIDLTATVSNRVTEDSYSDWSDPVFSAD